MPTLRVVHRSSALNGREVVVSDEVVRLGRSSSCQVLFDESDQTISRNHAELRWQDGTLYLHPSANHPVFRQGHALTSPTRMVNGDAIELVRVGGPTIVLFFQAEDHKTAEVTAPTLQAAPVVRLTGPQAKAAAPASHAEEDSKTESVPALSASAIAAARAALQQKTATPAAPSTPSALEGTNFESLELATATVPKVSVPTNGAAPAVSWVQGVGEAVAAAPQAVPPPAPPQPAQDEAPLELATEGYQPPPEPPPAPAPEPAPEPKQAKPFQRPRLSSPQVPVLEGVEVERAVTIEAPPKRKSKSAGSSYSALRLLYDLIIVGTLGVAGYFAYLGSIPVGAGIAGVALVLVIGRFVIWRGGGDAGEEENSFQPTFQKDALHSSAINLNGITDETPDRVARVAKLLSARGLDETVEVVDLVDDILICAEFLKSSDCHIEPKEHDIRISLRIDGVVQDVGVLPKELAPRIANRFRIISKLDFAKVDTPQDGRVEEKIRGKPMNLRVSVFPTAYGPKIVIRLLDSGAHALPPVEKLGIHPLVLKDFKRVINASQGIVLFTGPTGSGKTTLMYSALKEIIDGKVRRNVVTLEDPIERLFPQINQTQVDARRGLTFASGLRTILRQDPDVIMVGEIRDQDTAEIALRAGQTGHLLLSTLHTNSASAAFSRLMDMGIEPFLLASAITGVASSRLMRRLCPHCRVQAHPPESFIAQLQGKVRPDAVFYEPRGCEECRNTGYIGRMLAFELLTMNPAVANAVMARRSPDEIQKAAISKGMETILDDGLSKVKAGETSLEEVLRVLM